MQRCCREWMVPCLVAVMALPSVAVRGESSQPEGDEKNLVEAVYSRHHSISVITRSAGFASATARFQSWLISSGAGIVRHMWATAAGELLMHQSSSNRVGRVVIGS